MKLTVASLLFLAAPTAAVFHPQAISYDALLNGDISVKSSLVKALSETGLVSITGVPKVDSKDKALSVLHECALKSKASQEHTFPDGTRRLTLATHSVPGEGGVQKIDHKVALEACESFNEASSSFRSTVATVTQVFAERVAQSFEMGELEDPLLSTKSNVGFKTFSEVVEFGEHLEHFHSYQKSEDSQDNEETIEIHVDQGLFIAFTPGRSMHPQDPAMTEMTSGFFIELQDGSIEEVEFSDQDDLVFMLGDGVNQYINDNLSGKKLRAVPHTLRMDSLQDAALSRVWYGRMVLPPVDAVHPTHGMTFAELRERMISSSLNDQEEENVGLGCSGGMVARDLSATTCNEDATYCWHRCMNHTDFGVSNEICADRNLEVHCINPRNQIWAGENHGDFYPACADAATQEVETPFPTLDEYPRPEDICTDAEFDTFADSTGFNYSHVLHGGAKLMWSIEGDAVRGRIAFNGLFGWLAFGFANVGGEKNGMHGANILLALPGGNYSASTGLDLDLNATVGEYEIDPMMTAFRHWMTPLVAIKSDEVAPYEIDSTECFTAMSFQKSSIGKYTFDLEGTDELIWAANGENAWVTYHGGESRGRFAIHWPTGEVTVANREGHEDHDQDTAQGSDSDNDVDFGTSASAKSFGFVIVASTVAFALFGIDLICK